MPKPIYICRPNYFLDLRGPEELGDDDPDLIDEEFDEEDDDDIPFSDILEDEY